MLSREVATQMRGRSLSWELFPFSFAEFLDYKGIQVRPETSRNRLLAQKAFEEYWEKGGFPEARNVPERVRVMIHQEYFRTMVYRDIVERHDAMHPQAVMDLAFRLVNYPTQSGREVDFIWQDAEGKRHLAQVCESMAAHPETQRREVTALTEGMQEMKIKEGFIVTRSEAQEFKTPAGRIQTVPVWKFLLSE